jgi:Protein HRI1
MGTPVRVRFSKTLDSQNMTEPDEGEFTKLSNGDDFETGKMPCPEREMQVTEYEEVWRQIPPVPGPMRAWILESAGEGRKVFLGRIGGGYIAIGDKKGETFGARREEWDERRKSWDVKYKIGDLGDVPSVAELGAEGFEGEADWKMGNTVTVLGRRYLVQAFELLE